MQGLIPLVIVKALITADAADHSVAMQHECLIHTAAREAAGESAAGIQAVIEVIDNRAKAGYKGDDWCEVVHWHKQFAANDNPRPLTDSEILKVSQIAYSYLYGYTTRLLPEGTFHFINPYTALDLSWYNDSHIVGTFENHHFLKI